VVLRRQPDALLGLATGASPALAYDLLTAQGRTEQDLLRRVRVLKTDEWGGLSLDDPGSSEAYLRQRVVGPWGLGPERFTGWASAPADPEEAAARMRAWLATHGPLDACVLGLGVNGHLLMNEPAPALQPAAHVAQLAAATLGHAMLITARVAPRCGLTLGMADLLHAGEVLLLVSGAGKAGPLQTFLAGRLTTEFPASLLWLHPRLTVVCDRAAASATPALIGAA
jgi:galactosamine-6-phosphate isomerase